MSYNKYNTRSSGNYNVPGTFVPAKRFSERLYLALASCKRLTDMQSFYESFVCISYDSWTGVSSRFIRYPAPTNVFPECYDLSFFKQGLERVLKQEQNQPDNTPAVQMNAADIDMKTEIFEGNGETKPNWMKVKKISNKERRRRQNETLRRLLTPKNALMVLNEIMPGEHVANQFKVEQVANSSLQYFRPSGFNFRADLTLHGNNYKGFGENKLTARNAAAEQAIRDLMIKRMMKLSADDTQSSQEAEEGQEEGEDLPMIQLASYALHKLFSEWEFAGHRVPSLRSSTSSLNLAEAEPAGVGAGAGEVQGARGAARAVRLLPAQAASMHPCMLLGHMRPGVEYVQLPPEGERQHQMLFNVLVEVDGQSFYGKALSKKEARKMAARDACETLFNVQFDK